MRRIETIPLTEPRRATRRCDAPGCHADGEHRAPRSRDRLGEYYWFCLDHVRDYNRRWNFCANMNEREIEAAIREDTVWRRPTWPMGGGDSAALHAFESGRIDDGFGIGDELRGQANRQKKPKSANTPEQRALRKLDLVPPVNLTQLKTRYKELVKQLHPDANGGDRSAEDRLKDINEAYTTLKRFLTA